MAIKKTKRQEKAKHNNQIQKMATGGRKHTENTKRRKKIQ